MRSEDALVKAPLWAAAARALALFLGGFSLLNVLVELIVPGFDANVWWIDFRPLPVTPARTLLVLASLLLVAYAIRPAAGRRRRRVTAGLVLILLAVVAWNVIRFFVLLARGDVHAGFPVPFSLLVGAALGVILAALLKRAPGGNGRRGLLCAGATLCACVVAFPLAQMLCFGKTDYRRPAGAVVVFGARAYADGRPSQALADRVRTGCRLHLDGLADRVVFSGGPGDGDVHETEAMRDMAVRLGVPREAIVLDPDGLNTRATVRNTCALFERLGVRRVLAVSHSFHLPRIKMTYARAGREVYTVPAKETYVLTQMPYLMMREVAAFWVYYARSIAG